MTTRQDRVNSLVQKELGKYILRQQYEDMHGLVTITDVDVSADLSNARVYFSVVGQDEEEVLKILNEDIYDIQGYLNRELILRKVPRIKFMIDKSGEYAEHITDLIRQLDDGDE